MIDMTYWCESCARKNNCYTIRNRPKCFTPITSNDRTADLKTEPQYDIDKGTIKCDNCSENGSYKCSKCDGEMYFKRIEIEDEPQTDCSWK